MKEMRLLLAALIPAMLLPAADFQIDHVTVAGTDIRQMQVHLSAVGIASVYGGAHKDGATEMAMVSFPDGSYLELIALQSHADPHLVDQHPWSKFLRGDGGPCAWAVRALDLEADVRRLRTAGVAISEPVANGRERPDGVHLEWVTANIGPDPRGTFFPFLIHDSTARNLRAFPQAKPGNRDFRGVRKIVIAVRNLDTAIARYRQAYGLPAAVRQVDQSFGAQVATLGDAPVVLAEPLTSGSWLAKRLDQYGEAPCAFILGAIRPERYHAENRTRWFGADLFWFDSSQLGWRLGFEKAK
jgi:Glyoxalase-like domain